MSLQDDLKVAGKKLSKINLVYNDVQKRQYDRKMVLEDQIRKTLHEEFGAEMTEVYREKEKLQREYDSIMDRIALESVKLPYPEGTIFVKLKSTRDSNYNWIQVKSNERSVLQIFRKGDEIPQNKRWIRYGLNVGDIVLRELKKDGTPGKNIEKWNSMSNWEPEKV